MIRALTLAATAAVLATPVLAAETATPDTASAAAIQAQLDLTSAALQARQHLVGQGYINVSPLEKDANGRWVGTAMKDGKAVYVAIRLPVINSGPAVTN